MALRDTARGLLGGLQRFAGGVNGLLYPGLGSGVDPEMARRAQSQAMLQMGMGLLGGQDIGKAYGLGQAAGWEPIEQNRRQELMQAAAQDRQAQADERKRRAEAEQAAAQRQAQAREVAAPFLQSGDYEGARRALLTAGLWDESKAMPNIRDDGAKIGAYNPGDYTPESFAAFIKGGMSDPSALRRQYAPPQPAMTVIAGVPSIVNKGSGQVTPLSSYDAEMSARAGLAGAEQDAKSRASATVDWEAGAPKRDAKAAASQRTAQNVIGIVDKAIGQVGPFTTGFSGARLSKIEGSQAYDLGQNLQTIRANLGFDRLQEMRDNSPTGGALGQVAIQELAALQAAVASLDIGQSPEQLSANLQKIRTHYSNWQKAVDQAKQQGNPVGGGPRPGMIENGYRFKGGDPGDPNNWERAQ